MADGEVSEKKAYAELGSTGLKRWGGLRDGWGGESDNTCMTKKYWGRPARPAADRFWEKVDLNGPVPAHDPSLGPCWVWTAYRTSMNYGQFNDGEKVVLAHRWAKEYDGELVLDHLCRNPPCVRPDHLEAVTRGENLLRGENPPAQNAKKTHCSKGHLLAGENLSVKPGTNFRRCKACHREHQRRYKMKKAAQHG